MTDFPFKHKHKEREQLTACTVIAISCSSHNIQNPQLLGLICPRCDTFIAEPAPMQATVSPRHATTLDISAIDWSE